MVSQDDVVKNLVAQFKVAFMPETNRERALVKMRDDASKERDALLLLFYNAMNIGAMQGFPNIAQCQDWLDAICLRAQEVETCTRPAPHVCKVNGPCNGWPRTVCSGCGTSEGNNHNYDCPEAQD